MDGACPRVALPVHPASGHWSWKDDQIISSVFGAASQPTQPEYVPGDRDFGLFPRVESLEAGLQLEEEGVRSRIRWELIATP